MEFGRSADGDDVDVFVAEELLVIGVDRAVRTEHLTLGDCGGFGAATDGGDDLRLDWRNRPLDATRTEVRRPRWQLPGSVL